jgi:hypothetical protein
VIIRINIGCQPRCLLLVVMVHNLLKIYQSKQEKSGTVKDHFESMLEVAVSTWENPRFQWRRCQTLQKNKHKTFILLHYYYYDILHLQTRHIDSTHQSALEKNQAIHPNIWHNLSHAVHKSGHTY